MPTRPRRVSRREREARQRRRFLFGMGIIGALIVLILGVTIINESVVKPRTVIASVNGTEITRRDYWRYRGVELLEQVNQFSRLAGMLSSDQATQYRQAAAQAQAEFNELWGSTDVDDATLQQMIDDQLFVANLDELGLSISDEELDQFILNRFSPQDAPLIPNTPTPTLIPERAAWATETAAANPTTEPAAAATPGTTSPSGFEPLPLPPFTAEQRAELPATPEVESTPSAATPNPSEALATAEANYALFQDSVFERARISREQYREQVAKPQLARQKVRDAVAAQVGQTSEQVLASHILVETEDLARQIRAALDQPGADFAAIAAEQSTDTGSGANGGDLGWFTRGEMVEPFEEVAFSLPPGEISQPVQTEFGWHIIYVRDRDPDRPMTDEQIQQQVERAVNEWLEAQRAEAEIDADIDPTPTPVSSVFEPPVNAPPPPAEAPIPPPAPTSAPLPSPPGG
ncbi:MAG TPA: peptidylprolyl isomerase [Thermomicrobiales bacterium]|nr:peptidylprolyl isomerase [Thermomicrobiales bacterium]